MIDRRQEACTVAWKQTRQNRLAEQAHFVGDDPRGRVGRPLAGDGLIECGPQRIDVGPGALPHAGHGILLVGAVARLDQSRERLGVLGDLAAGRTEIDQHGRAIATDHDIVGGDVAVQEIGRVDDFECIEQRHQNSVQLLLPGRAAEALQPSLEALAFLEVQHDIAGVAVAEITINPDDVGMREARQRLRLLDEALETPGVIAFAVLGPRADVLVAARGEVDGEIFLDGDVAGERRLFRQIGDTETAGAQHPLDPVVTDQLGST